jgi:hypothetical protein
MADTTNIPGAICIQGGRGLRATLRPEWRPLLNRVREDLKLTATDILRRSIAAFPDANMAESLRLFIAAHFAGELAENLTASRLTRQLEGLQIPLPPYIVPE